MDVSSIDKTSRPVQRTAGGLRLVMVLVLSELAGCVPVTPALPYPPVPVPLVETMPKPPASPDPLMWRPGHWDWTGSSYAWERGQWEPRGQHGSLWEDGFWSQVNGGYVWVPAHWL